ncbi:hypothetical protein AB0I53_20375 [Saccharopolyspora sp. NPDC050389]|uniref:hypothetical protein n=1 Tax=Saccharopolyspora sp. NPDC050389 TaxID=3155516 RepID=UPI0033DFAB02
MAFGMQYAASAARTRLGSTGNDTALDTPLLRLHMETACRRGGALTPDLDPDQCLILLREKGESLGQPLQKILIDESWQFLGMESPDQGAALSSPAAVPPRSSSVVGSLPPARGERAPPGSHRR